METIAAGHVTVTPSAARFTLYRRVDDEHMMHVQYDLPWAELDSFVAGPDALCELVLESLLSRLDGDDPGDPCTG